MVAVNGDESIKIRTISPPNFEVSCAEGSPSGPGYWFGSDDGRIQFVSSDGVPILGPCAIALSGGSRQRHCDCPRSHGCKHP